MARPVSWLGTPLEPAVALATLNLQGFPMNGRVATGGAACSVQAPRGTRAGENAFWLRERGG